MQRWNSKREMMGDDPPYLAVGTEVSAKYKGAFCEAEVRKVVRSVKCKVAFKLGLGNATVTDDQIRGTLRAGSHVEVKHPEKKEFVEATITKIQDCSQYTVVFDDGDITTLRRTALCLKSGRHFAESETLDQLPLTHPEHFGNPVIGGRRGRRNRDDSSDDDESSRKGGNKQQQRREEKEADIGKVVCVEISEKKKQKDNWFPGLVVAPTAQDTVRIHVKEEYLVRSFKDGRYYTVPKKEATSFTREIGSKVDNNTLRTAVEKALLYLDKDELPPHWDRELLFGLDESSGSDSDAAFDSDSSDNEPREEKDHFVAQLYKFMDDRGTPINKGPTIAAKDVDLYKLFMVVQKLGGYNRVTNHNQWKTISHKLGFGQNASTVNLVKHAYKKFLHSFEDFYRKLGCTMISHPRNNRARHRSNRSLIRDRDRATPKSKEKGGDKDSEEPKEAATPQDAIKKEEVAAKEEEKPKEVAVETPKRESRSKEVMKGGKTTIKEEKVEKKETSVSQQEAATSASAKKGVEETKVKEEAALTTPKSSSRGGGDEGVGGGRPERSKERAVNLKAAAAVGAATVSNEEQHKTNKVMTNRRDTNKETKAKQEEKDNEEKAKSEVRQGKRAAPELKEQKKRTLFEKVTGARKTQRVANDEKPSKAKRPSLGLAAVRQKRSFKDRMKSIVRKFKLKGGGTSSAKPTLKSPPPAQQQPTPVAPPTNVPSKLASIPLSKSLPSKIAPIPPSKPLPSKIAPIPPSKPLPSKLAPIPPSKPLPSKLAPIPPSKPLPSKLAPIPPSKPLPSKLAPIPPNKPLPSTPNPPTPPPHHKRQQQHPDDDRDNDVADDDDTALEMNGLDVAGGDDDGHDDDDDDDNTNKDDAAGGLRSTTPTMPQRGGQDPPKVVTGGNNTSPIAHAQTVSQSQLPVQVAAALRPRSTPTDVSQLDSGANHSKNVQLTRSKSKEDMPIRVKKEKEPSSTEAKKSSSPQNSSSPNNGKEPGSSSSDADKRRGRKRKEDDKGSCEEVLDQLPSYKSVSVGDKLKVYYGPTHESKVTYEAKVLSTKENNSETLYLVHYTGWNTRYDEWIKRSRIADNLSWSPGRVKRNRQSQQQSPKTSASGSTKRGRSSDTGSSNGRSTTPSLTSPTSRPKLSSATRTYTRSKQISRRISGHTDFSDSDSGDESDSESDNENLSPLQKRGDKMAAGAGAGSSDEKDEMEIRTKRKAALAFAHTLSFESREEKRKTTAPSTSEDEAERDLEKCKEDSERKPPSERRMMSRASIEKETKEQSEEQGMGERRGRKLRSDRASRTTAPVSDSDDANDEKEEEEEEENEKKEGRKGVAVEKKKSDDSKSKVEIKRETNEPEDGQSSRESSKVSVKSVQNENSSKDDGVELSAAKLRSDKKKTDSQKGGDNDSVDKDTKSQPTDDTTNRSDRLRNRCDNKKKIEAKTADETKLDTKMQTVVDKDSNKTVVVESEMKPDIRIKEEPIGDLFDSNESKKKTRYDRSRKVGPEKVTEDESSQDTERNRRSRRGAMNRREDTVKASSSKDDSDEEQQQQPKGRDFDLMQIRSELKGIDKAVKMSLEMKSQSSEVDVKETITEVVVKKEPADVKVKDEPGSLAKEAIDLSADDIYEFKEPEPFEFEVRPKCSEEKGVKMQRRTFGRMCDEICKTTSPLKRKLIRSKPSPSPPPENKKRFRRSIAKKDESSVTDVGVGKVPNEVETSSQATEKKSVETVVKPQPVLVKPPTTEEQQKDVKNVVPEVVEKEITTDKTVVSEFSAKTQTNDTTTTVKPVISVPEKVESYVEKELKSADEPVKAMEKKVQEKVAEEVEKDADDDDDGDDDDDDDDGENRLVIFEAEEQEKSESNVASSLSACKIEPSKAPVESIKKVEEVAPKKDLITVDDKKGEAVKKMEPTKVDERPKEVAMAALMNQFVFEKKKVKNSEGEEEVEEEDCDEAFMAAVCRQVCLQDELYEEDSKGLDPLPVPPPVKTIDPVRTIVDPVRTIDPPHTSQSQSPSPILTSYKKDNKRRKVTISKEFIEESDSDSDVEVKPIPTTNTSSITTSLSLGTITPNPATTVQSAPVIVQKPVTVTIPSVLKTAILPVQTCASLKGNSFTLSSLQASKVTTATCGLIKPLGAGTNPPGTKILLNLATSVHRPPLSTVTTTGHLPILTTIHKPPPLTLTNPLARPCLSVLAPTVRPAHTDPNAATKPTLTVPILTAKPLITTSTNLPQTVSNFALLSSDIKSLPHLIPKPNFVAQSTTSMKPTPILIATTVSADTRKAVDKKESEVVKVEEKCIRIVTIDESSLKSSKVASESDVLKKEGSWLKKEEVSVVAAAAATATSTTTTVKDTAKEEKIEVSANLALKKNSTPEVVEISSAVEQKIVAEVIEVVEETVAVAEKQVVEKQNVVEEKPVKVEVEEEIKVEFEEMPKTNDDERDDEEEEEEEEMKLEIAVEEEVKSEDEEDEESRIMKEFEVAEDETMEADEDEREVEDDDMDADEEEEEEEEECVQSLLCEETIPGSPAPAALKDDDKEEDVDDETNAAELPFASAPGTSLHSSTSSTYTKPVVQQAPIPRLPPAPPPIPVPALQPQPPAVQAPPDTPPTTPDSSLSPISNSPRGERSGSSPGLDNDSTKSQRDSSEIDLDYTETNKIDHFSEEDSVCAASVAGTTFLKKPLGLAHAQQQHDIESSPSKKRRRSRKRSEDACKRAKLARRSPRNPAGSDSDDTSENSLAGSSLDLSSSRSPKPSKHNFYVQLDPELNGPQRIAVLQQKLQELRKTYMSLKTELACIDRRRKKLRRREREEKSMKQEVQCS